MIGLMTSFSMYACDEGMREARGGGESEIHEVKMAT